MTHVRPTVSVLVVHWNTPDLLRACIAALGPAAAGASIETVVVDNGSRGPGRPDLRPRRGLALLRNEVNRGFAAAANQAAAAAAGEHLLFLNTDVVLSPGSIPALLAVVARDTRLAAVAPVALATDGAIRFPGMRFLNPVNHAAGLLGLPARGPLARRWPVTGDPSRLIEVDWVRASTLLVRTQLFHALAGFDEGYYFYEEDEDFCWRLRKRGYRVAVAGEVRVRDPGGASTRRAGSWPARALYRGQARFVGRRFGPPGALAYRCGVSAALVARAVFTSPIAPRQQTGEILRCLWTRRGRGSTAEA